MKLTYDRSVDAAYIKLVPDIPVGSATNTYACNPSQINGAQINLDFDSNFVLIGIEVQNASKHLLKEILEQAEIIG